MKKVLRALVLTLVAVLALLGIKNEYARLLPASTFGMQAAIRQGEADHLFIGSSMFRQGLSIDVLEEELEGSSYILSYNGNQPVFMARELEFMLENGLTVKNVYVDLYPYTAAAAPWISDTKILLDTDLAFKLEAWKLMKQYSKTSFLDFYELFVTANNEQLLTYPINNRLISSQFRNGGNLLTPEGQTKEHLNSLGTLGSRDGLQEAQLQGYRELYELAQEYGINLYFIETPKYQRMEEDPDYRSLYEGCLTYVSTLEGAEMILSQDLNFDSANPSFYQDLIHLSAEGRISYTKLLCEQLSRKENIP